MSVNGRQNSQSISSKDLEVQTSGNAESQIPRPSHISRLRNLLRPSDTTIYTAILGTSDGMTVPFAVMASLAGVTDARLVMLAGLAELIAGAISMGAGGILGAQSDKERFEAEAQSITRLVATRPDEALTRLTDSLVMDLPENILTQIEMHYHTLSTRQQAALIQRFHAEPNPLPADTYKAAFTFFLTYFSGLPALIPYIVVRRDQVQTAFYISIAVTAILSFTYGWAKTAFNVGWKGWRNVGRGFRGGSVFFGVVACAAVLSVVIIRGIDHHL